MFPQPSCFRTTLARTLATAALLSSLGAGAARGDDRDLLRQASAEPYLFILLDTSGSMNWTPKSAACPTGDCFAPMQADDPLSKFYQARQALYQVLTNPSLTSLQLGFGTYNQDSLGVRAKHWLYRANNAGPSITNFGGFPATNSQEVFGLSWACDSSTDVGCNDDNPAELSNAWDLARVRRLPKGGLSFSTTINDFFVENSSGTVYRIRYTPVSGTYGGNLTVSVSVRRCTSDGCSTSGGSTNVSGSPATVTFVPVTRSDGLARSDFISWDNGANRNNPQQGYFTQGTASDSSIDSDGTCLGWDSNTDTNSDPGDLANISYNLRFPTDTSDPRNASFDIGDVIPLDWRTDHKEDILRRLAPNYPSPAPDFRIAAYLNDNRLAGQTYLRLQDADERPLFANGSTPILNSIRNFRTWYNGCTGTGNCAGTGGWVATASNPNAAIGDSSFNCRRKYLLVLTDGDETCTSGSASTVCNSAKTLISRLESEGVTTFVVAFGVENTSGNVLSCMEDAVPGESDHVFFPQDQAELIQSLEEAIGSISEDPRAFASAAVPSVQAEVADRIYLSSFRPIGADEDDPLVTPWAWDGHIDAYLKPLPLENGRPDKDRICPPVGDPDRSSCFLWDAGAVLKTQAPDRGSLTAPLTEAKLRLGLNTDQRRVFYPKANTGSGIPSTLRLLSPPAGSPQTDPLWSDLWTGFKLPTPTSTTVSPTYNQTKARIETIMKNTLMIKEATLELTGLPDETITYVLGDIFHAEPAIVDRPNDFLLYSANAHGPTPPGINCTNDTGYQCYAKKHSRRRKLLLVGANDGQLHAFDAGVWTGAAFNEGTGKELFSYIPRIGMPIVRNQTEGDRQIFSVDSTPRVDDVFIDPAHNGTPDATQREWRTVAIGGFREGGSRDGGGRVSDFYSGYYALDITQPDRLDATNKPINQDVVPSCLTLQNQLVSGCGPVPFPAVLWEFTDSLSGSRMDEDLNLAADLGQTWSIPTIGRIRVIENGSVTEKNVAIFGGGMDAENKSSPKSGNWLYMLDVETGKVIYKRRLTGSVTADPALLDVNLDGILDTLYVGTTAGLLYKVDISTTPTLQNVVLSKLKALPALTVDPTVKRITDLAWDPFPIFNTGGKPIYLPVTAFYAAQFSRFALTFGTGDREALWEPNTEEGRYYLIIDDNFKASDVGPGNLPYDDADYQEVPVDSDSAPDGTSYLLREPGDPLKRGWYISMPENERVITQSFGLSGVVVFSSFVPDETSPDEPCARGGVSHIFVVYADNGNAVMTGNPGGPGGGGPGGPGGGGDDPRHRTTTGLVTNPFVEQGQTKNPPTGGANSEILDPIQEGIMDAVKEFYPECTKFANYWISISGIRSDTGYERYATIPIGICESNWKEH